MRWWFAPAIVTLGSIMAKRQRLKCLAKAFVRDESGQAALEYALIGTVISIIIYGAMSVMSANMKGRYEAISAAFQ